MIDIEEFKMLVKLIFALLVVLVCYLGARALAAAMLLKRHYTSNPLITDAKHLEAAPIEIFTFIFAVIGSYLFYSHFIGT